MSKNKMIRLSIMSLIFLFFIILVISYNAPIPSIIEKILGIVILLVTIVSLVLIYSYIHKNKVYAKDLFGLIVDTWEIASLAIALILVSLVLILKH